MWNASRTGLRAARKAIVACWRARDPFIWLAEDNRKSDQQWIGQKKKGSYCHLAEAYFIGTVYRDTFDDRWLNPCDAFQVEVESNA